MKTCPACNRSSRKKNFLECRKCGSNLVLKVGRFGKFLCCETYPECKHLEKLWTNDPPKKTSTGAEKCVLCGQGPARGERSEMKASEADQILWDEVLKQNSKDVYEFYLQERPDGFFVEEARKRLDEFDAAPDIRAWQIAERENSKASYQEYLCDFPKGRFASEAKNRVVQLDRDHDRATENKYWKSAEKKKSADGYITYLLKYPSGIFVSVARLRLKAMGIKTTFDEKLIGSIFTNAMGIEFAFIRRGRAAIGSSGLEDWHGNASRYGTVTFNKWFWMGRYPVTQRQYKAVMGKNPSFFKKPSTSDFPVEQVSWDDAQEFVFKLNKLNDGFFYSLPNEDEWEYAARAGTKTATAFGDSLSSTQANFNGKHPCGKARKGPFLKRTSKVGSYEPNAWGLYDMHGNVWEWVENTYRDLSTREPAPVDNPHRVLRGGSWESHGNLTRSSVRDWEKRIFRMRDVGFRVVARAR